MGIVTFFLLHLPNSPWLYDRNEADGQHQWWAGCIRSSNRPILLQSQNQNKPHRIITSIIRIWSNNSDIWFQSKFIMEVPVRNNFEVDIYKNCLVSISRVLGIGLPKSETISQWLQENPTCISNLSPEPLIASQCALSSWCLLLGSILFSSLAYLLVSSSFSFLKRISISYCRDLF